MVLALIPMNDLELAQSPQVTDTIVKRLKINGRVVVIKLYTMVHFECVYLHAVVFIYMHLSFVCNELS